MKAPRVEVITLTPNPHNDPAMIETDRLRLQDVLTKYHHEGLRLLNTVREGRAVFLFFVDVS